MNHDDLNKRKDPEEEIMTRIAAGAVFATLLIIFLLGCGWLIIKVWGFLFG